jgi:hypothetical protein
MNELTNECLTELGVALKRFGTYSFDDKGPSEVMDIDRLVGKLRVMPVAEATTVLLELASCNEYDGRSNELACALVGELEDWDELFENPDIAEMY